MTAIKAVLFDLDGTLLDTAPDLIAACNTLLAEHHLPQVADEVLKPLISIGSKPLIQAIFNINDNDSRLNTLRQRFFSLYQQSIAEKTTLFPGMDTVLTYLETQQIPWGIVTNKLTQHTLPLLQALSLAKRASCVICGDTLSTAKPDPQPILHACALLEISPKDCLYIGDAKSDVIASKAAGTHSLVALYGYIGITENPAHWQADGYIKNPTDILTWLTNRHSLTK